MVVVPTPVLSLLPLMSLNACPDFLPGYLKYPHDSFFRGEGWAGAKILTCAFSGFRTSSLKSCVPMDFLLSFPVGTRSLVLPQGSCTTQWGWHFQCRACPFPYQEGRQDFREASSKSQDPFRTSELLDESGVPPYAPKLTSYFVTGLTSPSLPMEQARLQHSTNIGRFLFA